MSDETNINIQADYLTFKDEIIEKPGTEFARQTYFLIGQCMRQI
jgi:hypothetical protein